MLGGRNDEHILHCEILKRWIEKDCLGEKNNKIIHTCNVEVYTWLYESNNIWYCTINI